LSILSVPGRAIDRQKEIRGRNVGDCDKHRFSFEER